MAPAAGAPLDPVYQAIVDALAKMPEAERQRLLEAINASPGLPK